LSMWINKCGIPKIILTVIFIAVFCISAALAIPPVLKVNNVSAQSLSTCLNRLNIPKEDLHWVYVPEYADQLHTEENYFFLAGQLIKDKIVDASACPSGGLAANKYANACGMAAAKPAVIYIQNMLNEPILQAWKDVGVPPVLLKQLVRYESQFYPSQYNQTHFGFGHITEMGILNALDWNPSLYTKYCPTPGSGICATKEGVAYQILTSLVSTCPSCKYGIDPVTANRSVDILARVLMGYCYQTEQLIYNATGWNSIYAVDYTTIWKLTLMNYNAGPGCVFNAVSKAFEDTEGPIRWPDIVANTKGDQCLRGMYYATSITLKYFNFPPPS
jgi:hypothetical protein